MALANGDTGLKARKIINTIAPPIARATGHRIPIITQASFQNGSASLSGKLRLTPFILPQDLSVSALIVRCVTAAGAGVTDSCKLAIYNSTGNLTNPVGTLVRGTGSLDVATGSGSTGTKNVPLTSNASLTGGTLYFFGIMGNDNTMTFTSLTNDSSAYFQFLLPPTTDAGTFNNTSDVGSALQFNVTYASGLPADLSSTAPNIFGTSTGSVMLPMAFLVSA